MGGILDLGLIFVESSKKCFQTVSTPRGFSRPAKWIARQRNSQLASGISGYSDIRQKKEQYFFVGPLATTMVLSVGIASWDHPYESTTAATRSDGGDRSERVQATTSRCGAAHQVQVKCLSKNCSFFG